MAIIRWGGTSFSAEPVRQLPNGNWIMRAISHGVRWSPGTELEVTQGEIVEMGAAEVPELTDISALEDAMAKERETLPAVESLLKDVITVADAGREQKGESAERPTQAPLPAPPSTAT